MLTLFWTSQAVLAIVAKLKGELGLDTAADRAAMLAMGKAEESARAAGSPAVRQAKAAAGRKTPISKRAGSASRMRVGQTRRTPTPTGLRPRSTSATRARAAKTSQGKPARRTKAAKAPAKSTDCDAPLRSQSKPATPPPVDDVPVPLHSPPPPAKKGTAFEIRVEHNSQRGARRISVDMIESDDFAVRTPPPDRPESPLVPAVPSEADEEADNYADETFEDVGTISRQVSLLNVPVKPRKTALLSVAPGQTVADETELLSAPDGTFVAPPPPHPLRPLTPIYSDDDDDFDVAPAVPMMMTEPSPMPRRRAVPLHSDDDGGGEQHQSLDLPRRRVIRIEEADIDVREMQPTPGVPRLDGTSYEWSDGDFDDDDL